MRKVILLVLFLLIGFYVGWPALSGWQIKQAIDTNDAAKLDAKVDFPAVRASLLPIVRAEVDARAARAIADLGPSAAILGARLKDEMAPKIAQAVLDRLVTADSLMRIASHRGTIKQAIEALVGDQIGGQGRQGALGSGNVMGNLGGLLGRKGEARGSAGSGSASPVTTVAPATAANPVTTVPPASASGAEPKPAQASLANIKSFAVTGPASFALGYARDPAATSPELIVDMAFTNFDWKLVGLRPKL